MTYAYPTVPDLGMRLKTLLATYRDAGGKIQLDLLPGVPHNFVNMAGPNLDRALGLMKTFMEQQLARQ